MTGADTLKLDYNSIYDQLPEAIFISDRHTARILDCNSAAERLMQRSKAEIVGMHQSALYAGGEAGDGFGRFTSFVRGEGVADYEAEVLTKDGENIPVVITTSLAQMNGTAAVIQALTPVTGRQQAEETASKSERLSDPLFENTIDGIVIVDAETLRIVHANQTVLKMYGFDSVEEIAELNLFDYVHPDDRDRALGVMVDDMFGRDLRQVEEFRTYTKDGEEKWLSVVGTRIEYQGKLAGFLSFRDITEQKRVEYALRESGGRLRTIIEAAPDVIFEISASDGTFESLSPAFERITGFCPEEFIGRPFTDIALPDDVPVILEKFQQVLQAESPETFEARFRTRSGGYVDGEIIARPLLEGGKVARVIGLARDITERKRADEALRKSEAWLRSLVENAPYLIIILDRDYNIMLINRTVPGYTLSDVIGKSVFDYVSAEHHDEMRRCVDLVFETGDPSSYEVTGKRADGTTSWYSISAGPIKRDGEIVAVILLSTDITDHKQAEQELRESEERYRLLANNVTDVIFTMDMNLQRTYVSPSSMQLRGYTPEEDLAQSMEEILTPASLKVATTVLMEELAKEELEDRNMSRSRTLELEQIRKDGSTVWTEVRVTFLRDAEGRAIGLVGVARDITDRRQAEEALREGEEHLRSLMESAKDYVVYRLAVDKEKPQGAAVVFASPSIRDIMRVREPNDIETWYEHVHEEDIERILEADRHAREIGESFDEVFRVYQPGEEEWRWIHAISTPTFDSEGNPTHFNGLMVDITDRKQAEEALRASEAKFRQVFSNVGDTIAIVDIAGKITDMNERVKDLVGYSPEELVGHDFVEIGIIDSEQAVKLAEGFMNAVAAPDSGGQPFFEFQTTHKEGHRVHIEAGVTAIRGTDGKLEGFLSVIRNISERKRAEAEIARIKKENDAQLVQSAKLASLGEMATGIAHEINQPLNIIKLTSSGLQRSMKKGKTIGEEALTEELESIDGQVERMRAIIDHMRNFARQSSDIRSEYTDMNIPLRECFRFVGEQLRLREIEVQMDLHDLPQVMADSNKMEQVFLNIIMNARDAMDEFAKRAGADYKKVLKVRSFVEDGKVVVTLSDAGGGVPKGVRDKIFEPFFTTKEVGKGTGLGLSISYNIVKDFGGTLDFSVDTGVGTTFRVELPIAHAADQGDEKDDLSSS